MRCRTVGTPKRRGCFRGESDRSECGRGEVRRRSEEESAHRKGSNGEIDEDFVNNT